MIGVLSDSHDNLHALRKAVGIFHEADCRLIVHAGDFVAPFAVAELRALGCPVKAVFGNCDGERPGLAKAFDGLGEIREAPLSFSFEGLRFLVSHLDAPIYGYLVSERPDVLVYGHTHRPLVEWRGSTLLLNPGETGGWLHGRSTVALFDPKSKTAKIISLD
jgi:putative phosphoesterase